MSTPVHSTEALSPELRRAALTGSLASEIAAQKSYHDSFNIPIPVLPSWLLVLAGIVSQAVDNL